MLLLNGKIEHFITKKIMVFSKLIGLRTDLDICADTMLVGRIAHNQFCNIMADAYWLIVFIFCNMRNLVFHSVSNLSEQLLLLLCVLKISFGNCVGDRE